MATTKRRVDWKRAGDAVEARRYYLGIETQRDAAYQAGLGLSAWADVERGVGPPSLRTTTKVTKLLRWPGNALDRLAEGEPADQIPDIATDEVSALRRELHELRELVESLEALVRQLLRGTPQDGRAPGR